LNHRKKELWGGETRSKAILAGKKGTRHSKKTVFVVGKVKLGVQLPQETRDRSTKAFKGSETPQKKKGGLKSVHTRIAKKGYGERFETIKQLKEWEPKRRGNEKENRGGARVEGK